MTYKTLLKSGMLCVLCLVTGVLARAQKTAEPDGLRFRTFGWQTQPKALLYDQAGKDVPVEVLDSVRSRFYNQSGSKKLVLYRLITNAEGKKVRQPVVTVDLAEAGVWPLLVFIPDKAAGPDGFRVIPVAADLKSFPAPQFHFVNFTSVPLGLALGADRLVLQPGAVHAMDPALKSGEAATTRYFMVSIATEEGPKMMYANNWVVRPSQRTLVLIFAEDQALQVRRVVDDVNQYAAPAP